MARAIWPRPSTQLPSSTQHEDLAIWKQHRTIPKERVKAADKMDEHRAWKSVATTGTIWKHVLVIYNWIIKISMKNYLLCVEYWIEYQ